MNSPPGGETRNHGHLSVSNIKVIYFFEQIDEKNKPCHLLHIHSFYIAEKVSPRAVGKIHR